MLLEKRNEFANQIKQALSSAETIADRAAAGKYVADEVSSWKDVFIDFGTGLDGMPGYFADFDIWLKKIFGEQGEGPGIALEIYVPAQGHATGAARDSEAVLNAIAKASEVASPLRTLIAFRGMEIAYQQGLADKATEHYQYFVDLQDSLYRIFNTMRGKMNQGPRPAPVPGPGQVLVNVGFGEIVLNKGDVLISGMTVKEFLESVSPAIGQIVKKSITEILDNR